jgi:hypothetical protein
MNNDDATCECQQHDATANKQTTKPLTTNSYFCATKVISGNFCPKVISRFLRRTFSRYIDVVTTEIFISA